MFIPEMQYITHLPEIIFQQVKNMIEIYVNQKHFISIGTFFKNALYRYSNFYQNVFLCKLYINNYIQTLKLKILGYDCVPILYVI